MKIPYFEVAAFASRPFEGNPAGVCVLEKWLPDALLQSIAAENNLSETAFIVARGDLWELRWHTPLVEIDLCGHATLASAHVILRHLGSTAEALTFHSPRSGMLKVLRENDLLVLDFPSQAVTPCDAPEKLLAGLGHPPQSVYQGRDYLVVFETEAEIATLEPDFTLLAELPNEGVIVTARGSDCDFVSRFFVPKHGIDEDPVTGSTHCALIPFWANRLDKKTLLARQLSKRGGELFCEDRGDRVRIGGCAATYLIGEIDVP